MWRIRQKRCLPKVEQKIAAIDEALCFDRFRRSPLGRPTARRCTAHPLVDAGYSSRIRLKLSRYPMFVLPSPEVSRLQRRNLFIIAIWSWDVNPEPKSF